MLQKCYKKMKNQRQLQKLLTIKILYINIMLNYEGKF